MNKKVSLLNIFLYFLTLGTVGFGGSIALARSMQKDLVEKRKWITEKEFLQGLTLSQLAPGPLAAQLAIYIGYIKASITGATIAGLAFVFPSFLIVLLISIFYRFFGNSTIIQSFLYGIGAAIIGIIASSGYSLTKRTMKKNLLLWIIYLAVFLITVFAKTTNIFIFLAAGVLTLIFKVKGKLPNIKNNFSLLPMMSLPPIFSFLFSISFVQIFVFFFIAGSIAFGGGLAIVPFLQHGVVSQYHWLNNKQFIDAVSIAMITPGPVVIAATFIGYMAANIPGAILATLAIFLPVYLIVIFLTPLFKRHAENPKAVAFIEGVLAAAMGSIAGSVILLGESAITDLPTIIIGAAAFLCAKYFKIPAIIIVLVAAIIGAIIKIK